MSREPDQRTTRRRTVLKGILLGAGGTAASYLGLTRFIGSSMAEGTEPQEFPETTDSQIETGFDRLDNWDAHIEETKQIGTDVLGYRQALDLMKDQFGDEGEQDFVEHVGNKVSPFHYDYMRDLAGVAENTGRDESDLFNDLYERLDDASTIPGAESEVDDTEHDLLTTARSSDGDVRAPQELSTTEKVIEESEQDIFGLEDKVRVLANDQGEINGTVLQGENPNTFDISFDVDPQAESGRSVVIAWLFWETEGCVVAENWIPLFIDDIELPSNDQITFRLEPDEDHTTALRIQLFGQNVDEAFVKSGWIPDEG